jgi:translation elongation factor EF-4
VTAPTVPYRVVDRDGSVHIISNPSEFPSPQEQAERGAKLFEPMVEATMIFPTEYLGDVIEICEENRGMMLEQNYVAATRCLLKYKLPLAHLVDDFFGKIKGRTRGYASLDYEDLGFEPSDIVKMEVPASQCIWLIEDVGEWRSCGCSLLRLASKLG